MIKQTLSNITARFAVAAVSLFAILSLFAQTPEASPGARATGGALVPNQPNAPVAGPSGTTSSAPTGVEATAQRVIVTGSNIPTAEETGPSPVDTYRTEDIQRLGIRNTNDLIVNLPQESGGTVNQQIGNGGDGTVQINLRGILPKETLVLIDGKRFAPASLFGGFDINLIPFPFIDHIDILKDGASAVYGADAVAGVVNIFLKHKFRGLEIGGSYGNTNLGASNDTRETEGWILAGTGDDKTDIVVGADFYDRAGLFSRDRDISSNGDFSKFFGTGVDFRSVNEPGSIVFNGQELRLIPRLFFSAHSPPPHSAANAATSRFYVDPFAIATYPDGNYFYFNFAAFTPDIPAADRQSYYGSFTQDLCDKYLTIFADFKYTRSFFDSSLAAVPFSPDPFRIPGTSIGFSPDGISVPISNPFNPFTVGDTTLVVNGVPVPMTTGVRYRGLNDTGPRSEKFTYNDIMFDVGLRGEMGEFGDYFKRWNWELGFRYARNEGLDLSINEVSQPGLREALLDTNPATAFNPFVGFFGSNTKAARGQVYVNLHNTGSFELPLWYFTLNGDIVNLPAGPLSFAIGVEYHGEREDREVDPLNSTFQTIGSTDAQGFRVNRDVWATYQELRIPVTSPTWNFPGFYSLEFGIAEREEWYSNNTSSVLASGVFPAQPAAHSSFNAQKPKFSVRWQPLDPKWIGAVTLRGSYSEAFHAPTLFELTPSSSQNFPAVTDPFSTQTQSQTEERLLGNPLLKPETAYEWTYGVVYSPKWLKGLTLSADWWHIDMRSIVSQLGAEFLIEHNPPPPTGIQNGPVVFRAPTGIPGEPGAVILVIDPNQNLSGAIFEGLDWEGIYVLDSSTFGAPDLGRFTLTANGTWLSRAELQPSPDTKRFGIAGQFLPTGFSLTSSLPRHKAYFSLYYDGPDNTWMSGFETGAVVHFISQYNDDLLEGFDRKVREWITLDLSAAYTFNMSAPTLEQVPGYAKDGGKNVKTKDGKEKNVVPVSTAAYSECAWRSWLNGTTLTLGMQNVTDEDPPFVAGSFESGYDESLTTIKGRFWYVELKKRF
jgi:iron complex outermembrane recepter protein